MDRWWHEHTVDEGGTLRWVALRDDTESKKSGTKRGQDTCNLIYRNDR